VLFFSDIDRVRPVDGSNRGYALPSGLHVRIQLRRRVQRLMPKLGCMLFLKVGMERPENRATGSLNPQLPVPPQICWMPVAYQNREKIRQSFANGKDRNYFFI